MLSIKTELCNQCGVCSAVCPAGVISSDNGLPQLDNQKKIMCIRCGNCEAHCPQGAINMDFKNAREFSGAHAPFLTPGQIGCHIANRRSVRDFKKTPVDRETIEELLDIVRYAPTAKNIQNVEWLIVSSREKLEEILDITAQYLELRAASSKEPLEAEFLTYLCSERKKGRDLIFWDAPHLALAYEQSKKSAIPINGTIAASCFMLTALAFGLGTCWAGYLQMAATNSGELNEMLQLPEGYLLSGALMFGYPKYQSYRIPKRKAAKVVWL